MKLIRKFLGPVSKYDASIPYTYFAKVSIIDGNEELFHYYFSDTICRLLEYLDEQEISPTNVSLFGCYRNEEILVEKEYCISAEGKWLKKPDICKSLEARFKQTLEIQYKGHVASGNCSFDDRDKDIINA